MSFGCGTGSRAICTGYAARRRKFERPFLRKDGVVGMAAMYRTKNSSLLERMIQQQMIDRGIREERLLAAMRSVPREPFFPDEAREEAYADRATPIGHGQTISQPYRVEVMTQYLDLRRYA